MAKPTIIIDAGHGGFDNGAQYQGRREKDDNLRLALAVGNRLREDGYPVVFTRTEDIYQRPIEKAQIANASGGDYFVSFHRNASPEPDMYSGIQTLVFRNEGEPARLAQQINEQLSRTGFRNLGVEVRPNLVVLRRTQMPAVLVETGFINTDTDNRLFDAEFDRIADAIAAGIEAAVSGGKTAKTYGVQVGLYRRYENAAYALAQVLAQGYDGLIRERDPYFAVVVGNTPSLEEARRLEQQLQRNGYDTLIVENEA